MVTSGGDAGDAGDPLTAALAEVDRLQAEVVRLHARLQVLEEAAALRATQAPPRLRGLASLINSDGRGA